MVYFFYIDFCIYVCLWFFIKRAKLFFLFLEKKIALRKMEVERANNNDEIMYLYGLWFNTIQQSGHSKMRNPSPITYPHTYNYNSQFITKL